MLSTADYISFALSGISIVLALVFYRRSRIQQSLSFRSISLILIQSKIAQEAGFKVDQEGDKVAKGTIGMVLFWNSGNATLRMEDFAQAYAPFVWIKQKKGNNPPNRNGETAPIILDSKIECVSHVSNGISVNVHNEWERGDHVLISFEYLAPGDGALISAIYDQKEPFADLHLAIEGRLKNGHDVEQWKGHKRYDSFFGISFFAFLGLSAVAPLLGKLLFNSNASTASQIIQGVGLLCLIGVMALRRRFGFGRAKKDIAESV